MKRTLVLLFLWAGAAIFGSFIPLSPVQAQTGQSMKAPFGHSMQAQSGQFVGNNGTNGNDGSRVVSLSMLESIRADHARTYSAIAVLEEYLLPGTTQTIKREGRWHEAMSVFVGFESLFDAARTLDPDGIVRPYDVHAFRIGLGSSSGRIGFYYAAAANMGYMLEGYDYERTGAIIANYFIGYPYAAVAPFVGTQQLEAGVASVMTLDYVAGVSYDLGIANVGLGYVGTTGFYYTIHENRLNAYLRGLFESDSFQDLMEERNLYYLAAGLERFDYFLPDGRQGFADLEYVLSTWRLPDGRKLTDRRLGRFSQRDIFGVLDLNASYSWRPQAEVSELSVGLHTYGYHRDLAQLKTYGGGGFRRAYHDWGFAAGVQAGYVTLPDIPEYLVRGGRKVSYSAEAILFYRDRLHYRLYLRHNHHETLEMFPYAQGALDFGFDIVLNR